MEVTQMERHPLLQGLPFLPGIFWWRLMFVLGGGSPSLLPQRLWWELAAPCGLFQTLPVLSWATKLAHWHPLLCSPGEAVGEPTVVYCGQYMDVNLCSRYSQL